MTKDDIIKKYLGAPYKYMGRDLSGIDCWGLAICIYSDSAKSLVDIDEDYDERWGRKGKNYFIENYYKQWKRCEAPAFMDGVLFRNKFGIADHGGIMLDAEEFIHATKRFGVIISKITQEPWKSRIEGFYRLKC